MIISDKAVENRISVFFLTLLIVVGGVFCYITLPREAAPDIQIPFVFVTTAYRGASPEDVEQLLTIPIEDKLKGLSGVKEVRSVSAQGQSLISIEFETGHDINDARVRVKDKVDQAMVDLPTDMDDDPIVSEMNFSEMPILVISLAGDTGERQLGKLADDLKDKIEKISGVLEVDLAGKVDRQIQVLLSPSKMVHYRVPFTALSQTVSGENQNISGGSVEMADGNFQLRVPSQFKNVDQAEELVVYENNGSPVYLRDVGRINDGLADRKTESRMNGRASILLYVKKRSGANIIYIVDEVKSLLEKSRETWPQGLDVTVLSDEGDNIEMMIEDLQNNILTGLLLVVIVVCFAMGFRNALIVSLSIPLSMLLSFIVLMMLGITLNMVVLFSLTLALGMLVDNAIVIVENVYRFMQQGVPRKEAAMRATSEVAWPIIGSAFTTIFAFVPLLWWDGVMGGFMGYIPKTVIITLVCCLFVAMIINPAIAAAVMYVKTDAPRTDADSLQQQGEHPMLDGGGAVLATYRWVLRIALGNRFSMVAGTVFMVILSVMIWFAIVGVRTPTEFFPTPDPEQSFVDLRLPQGVSLAYADRMVREATKRVTDEEAAKGFTESRDVTYAEAIQPKTHTLAQSGESYTSPSFLPDVKLIFEKASIMPEGGSFFAEGEANRVTVNYVDIADRQQSSKETQKAIEEAVADLPGAEVFVTNQQAGPPTGAPVNIEISGQDFNTLGILANRAKQYIEKVDAVRNVRSDFESGSPTMHLVVDRKRAAALGLNSSIIGTAIRSAFSGVIVSTYREEDEKFDILVRFEDKERDQLDTLRQLFIPTPRGLVPLTTVANIEYTGGLGRITRVDYKRVVTVQADVDDTQTTGDTAMAQAQAFLEGSSLLRYEDVADWPGLLRALDAAVQSSDATTPKGHVARFLTDEAKAQIAVLAAEDTLDEVRVRRLVNLINTSVFTAKELYDAEVFSAESLSPELLAWCDMPVDALSQKELATRNRGLLMNVFPEYIGPSSMPPFAVPPGYDYSFKGQSEEKADSAAFLIKSMAIALLLILLILVMQFNSILYPMVIMSSVALSLGGVFLGLAICNMPFGIIMTGVGVISLAGVVVNNAIVLVDYTIQLRKRGLALHDAIVAAGATRLRPVLLTAITTILGLIPMALGVSYDFTRLQMQWQSESSQWWRPMAVAVIFGLIMATILTLVVVPVLLSLVDMVSLGFANLIRSLQEAMLGLRIWWYGIYDRLQAGPPVTPRLREEWIQSLARTRKQNRPKT